MKLISNFIVLLAFQSCFVYSFITSFNRLNLPRSKVYSNPPLHTFSPENPLQGEVVHVKQLGDNGAGAATYHIQIRHFGKLKYLEGQHVGVIVPGTDPATGLSHRHRLYSISSARDGDDGNSDALSLCVRRVTPSSPTRRIRDNPSMAPSPILTPGLASNYLCDAEPGTKVLLSGPMGEQMLLPSALNEGLVHKNAANHFVFVATGTGIAPFRGMIRRLMTQQQPFTGSIDLYFGVSHPDAILYDDDWIHAEKFFQNPDPFRSHTVSSSAPLVAGESSSRFNVHYAFSRIENYPLRSLKFPAVPKNQYVQDVIRKDLPYIVEKLRGGAHIYFCGLKGMMPDIMTLFRSYIRSESIDLDENSRAMSWEQQYELWCDEKRWHVDVF